MMFRTAAACLWLLHAAVAADSLENSPEFETWLQLHRKSYDSVEEKRTRLETWRENDRTYIGIPLLLLMWWW